MTWEQIADVLGLAALAAGSLLCLSAAIGINRLPDFFSRMHAATKPQVLGLLLVLGLIFGLAWLARRMPGMTGLRGNAGLRVVRSLALGTRERLVVVEVGGTQLLLGTGAGGTRLLHTLETPLVDDAPAQPTPFAQLLAQRLGKKPA